MYQLLIIIHVTVAILLVAFILLQQGKGASTGASFGSGASTTVFGSQGSAGFMSRTTWFLVTCFFVVNLGLAYLTNSRLKTDTLQDLQVAPSVAPGVTDSAGPVDAPTSQDDSSDIPTD